MHPQNVTVVWAREAQDELHASVLYAFEGPKADLTRDVPRPASHSAVPACVHTSC